MVMRYANDMPETATIRPATLAADLRVSVMKLARRLRLQRSDDDISTGQYSVLGALVIHGPKTPRELAEHEKVTPPSMTRTLNCLVDAGLVMRTDHPADGRQVLMSVTERGSAVVHETRRQRTAWLAQRLAELTPEERTILAQASRIALRIAES
jgi:DNA-binding MarR family transcriptional regulator